MRFNPKVECTKREYDTLERAMALAQEFCDSVNECEVCPCYEECNNSYNNPKEVLAMILNNLNPVAQD